MFFLVYFHYYLFIHLFNLLLTGGCLWWAIEGIYVSGIHIVGGVNMCIYSRIYTVNTLQMNTYLYLCTPPLVGGVYRVQYAPYVH